MGLPPWRGPSAPASLPSGSAPICQRRRARSPSRGWRSLTKGCSRSRFSGLREGNSAMVEIRHLEVTFDVEGEGDAAVFARLFAKHAEAWSRREEEKARRQR